MEFHTKPFLMGSGMGVMMLFMLHHQMTGQSAAAPWAVAGFIGLHVIVILALGAIVLFAGRRFEFVNRVLEHLKRHVLSMFIGMVAVMAILHLILHRGF